MHQSIRERTNDVLNSVIGGIIVAILLGVIVSGIGITIWARLSELSVALVTALALSAVALIVAIANLALTVKDKWTQRGQEDGVGLPRISLGASTAEVQSDGILWRHNGVWRGNEPHNEAFCPEHRVPLMAWSAARDEFFDATTRADIDIERGDCLWCVGREDSERHELKLTTSSSWEQAVALANVRVRAQVVENDRRKPV